MILTFYYQSAGWRGTAAWVATPLQQQLRQQPQQQHHHISQPTTIQAGCVVLTKPNLETTSFLSPLRRTPRPRLRPGIPGLTPPPPPICYIREGGGGRVKPGISGLTRGSRRPAMRALAITSIHLRFCYLVFIFNLRRFDRYSCTTIHDICFAFDIYCISSG
jgi:hypothetical protein